MTILKLFSLGVAFTAASILSPTFLYGAIKSYLKYKIREVEYLEYLERRRIQRALYYLKRKKFIAFSAQEKKPPILTRLGLNKIKQIEYDSLTIKRLDWDGKWRILVFDIPEDERNKRTIFRNKLKDLGFYNFQRSVFLTPFPCEKEIEIIKQFLKIEASVHLVTADRFPGDKILVSKFNLKLVPQK